MTTKVKTASGKRVQTLAQQERDEEFKVRANNGTNVDSSEYVGKSTLIRFSPINAAIEQWTIEHFSELGIGDKRLPVSVIPRDSHVPVKCYWERTGLWLTPDNTDVATFVWCTQWLNLPIDEFMERLVHESVHLELAVHNALHPDAKVGVAANGQHDKKVFRERAANYFAKDSFITQAMVDESAKSGDGKFSQLDVNTPLRGSLLPDVAQRLKRYAIRPEVLKLRRFVDDETDSTRPKSTAVRMGCPRHHWQTLKLMKAGMSKDIPGAYASIGDKQLPPRCPVDTSKPDAKSVRYCNSEYVAKPTE